MSYKETLLWKKTLHQSLDKNQDGDAREKLRIAYEAFREKSVDLASHIPVDLIQLTEHGVMHMDALWDVASTIAGDIDFNPLEAFIFGGAVLLHDLGNTVASYPNGLEDLKGDVWNDLVIMYYRRREGREPTEEELKEPRQEYKEDILLERLRDLHANAAKKLATRQFRKRPSSTEIIYLIENSLLRDHYGDLIGSIAASHHWNIEKVESEFGEKDDIPSPPGYPEEWKIDALKIALLLRVSDAAHIDSRRAPIMAFSVRQPKGTSFLHWNFQEHLQRPTVKNGRLIYYSKSPFGPEDADSWWLFFDTLQMIHRELDATDNILNRRRKKSFNARGVLGFDSVETISKNVKVEGWIPINAQLRITDPLELIKKFAGKNLYGDFPLLALRELVANAADAIRARRILEKRAVSWGEINIRLGKEEDKYWLEVEDNGVGMSKELLSGPLLDFGKTYWGTWLARKEHPGLISRKFIPTGKFGIGFFSIFMLGDKVKVTSRLLPSTVRRETDTYILEFNNGISARPILRKANKNEWKIEPGTVIRIYLNNKPGQGILKRQRDTFKLFSVLLKFESDIEREKALESISEPLLDLLKQLSPTLDSRLSLHVLGEENKPITVVENNDWMVIHFNELLKRLSAEKGYAGESYPDTLIFRDKIPIARLGVPRSKDSQAIITVGGLISGSYVQGFPGVMLGDSTDLRRFEAIPIITFEELKNWLPSIVCHLEKSITDFDNAAWYGNLCLQLELRPPNLKCFLTSNGPMSFNELISKKLPSEIKIAISTEFKYSHLKVDKEFDLQYNKLVNDDNIRLDDNVIISPCIYIEKMQNINFPRWIETLPSFVKIDGDMFPWSLPLYCIEAIVKNWGMTKEDIINPKHIEYRSEHGFYPSTVEIGTYAGVSLRGVVLEVRRNGS